MKPKKAMNWQALGRLGCCIILCFGCLSTLSVSLAAEESQDHLLTPSFSENQKVHQTDKKVVIIIDDLGNGMQGTEEIMALPVKVTVAVMPFLPTTEADARKAHEVGHDVIIHLPMEPKQGSVKWLGPGAILSKMTNDEIRRQVEAAIDNVPYAIGINNHMGSKVTEDERVMSVILDVCRERGLIFVDSRTNYRSVILKLCEQKGLPQIKNDIFLDDVQSEAHISKQIRKVAEQVQTEGRCVTIGHVGAKKGKKTAAVIKEVIPKFQEQGIEFVGIGDMVDHSIAPGRWPGAEFILK